jgi:hypothetical protein
MKRSLFCGFLASLTVVGACSSEGTLMGTGAHTGVGGSQSSGGSGGELNIGGAGGSGAGTSQLGCDGVDILFVVDNSPSMVQEQENLAANFPAFILALEQYQTARGIANPYHVGVVTTAVTRTFEEKILAAPAFTRTVDGQDGVLQGQVACGLGPKPWLEGPGADVATKFSCMASVGTDGPGREMPFAALEFALGDQSALGMPNEGFYRAGQNTLLAVVLITDEDDCSVVEGGTIVTSLASGIACDDGASIGLYEEADVATYLDDLTGGPGRSVVAAVAGPGPDSCNSAFGKAIYALRIDNFIDLLGQFGLFGDICLGDLSTSLTAALDVITATCDQFPTPR